MVAMWVQKEIVERRRAEMKSHKNVISIANRQGRYGIVTFFFRRCKWFSRDSQYVCNTY